VTTDFRPLRDADYGALASLLNEASVADGRAQHQVAEEIREEFESHPVDLATQTFAAWHGERLVGAVYLIYLRSTVREERCYVFGAVHPDHRGLGIGRRLLQWGLERGTNLLQSSRSDLPKYLRVDISRTNTSAIRLYERLGLQPIRYFADLRADLSEPTPTRRAPSAASIAASTAASTSTAFRIVPWDLSRNEEARHVKNAAFMDHWGSTPTPSDWWTTQTSGFGARPDWSFSQSATTTKSSAISSLIASRTTTSCSAPGMR